MQGIALILPAVALNLLSWWFHSKRETALSVTLLILAGGLLRLHTISDPYLHDWDERYHALVAKNLMERPLQPRLYAEPVLDYDYRNWSGNHIWLYKQPLPL